jgi:large subunit ribosomal protein L3
MRSLRESRMTGIIGRKLGMTRIFAEDGTAVPVTVIEAGPCVVTRVRTAETDGYGAVQLGFGEIRRKLLRKPVLGQFDAAKLAPKRKLKEFPVSDPSSYSVGQEIKVDIFETGELVDVTGWSKGRGFQGMVKRHNKAVGRMTHGNKSKRAPGSIGSSASPSRVWRGKKLPGRMGNERVTVRRISVVEVDAGQNLLLVRGAVPGSNNGIVLIRKTGGAGR